MHLVFWWFAINDWLLMKHLFTYIRSVLFISAAASYSWTIYTAFFHRNLCHFWFFFKYCSGLEIVDAAARCFNCGSYSHALRECPRPRDHVAVNNARKQHKSRRNQNPSRNPTRYYQNTPAGKYDGLRPGALDDVTRKLLGLGVRVIENAVLMF